MSAYTDRELVNAAARGDASAYAILVERHARRIHAVAYARLLNAEDARDAVQDAFVLAYERLPGLIHPEQFGVWISVIARRCVNRLIVRRRREIPSGDDALLTEQPDESTDIARVEMRLDAGSLLARAVARLPESSRVPLMMRVMSDMTHAQIAETLAITPTAAQVRVSRALSHLRDALRGMEREEDARALLRSYAPVVAPGAGFAREVLARVSDSGQTLSSRGIVAPHVAAAAMATGLVALLVTGVYWAWQWTAYVAPGADGQGFVPVVLAASKRRDPARPVAATPPRRERVLLGRGDEHVGWLPAQPEENASTVRESRDVFSSEPAGAVLDNPYGVYRPLPRVEGVVTIELWLRPSVEPVNFLLSLAAPGDDHSMGRMLLHKDESNVWHTNWNRPGEADRVFSRVHEAQQFRIVYRTWCGTWDIYLDGALMVRDASHPGQAGKPFEGLWMTSGRGDRGAATYFDDLRVTVREPTLAELATYTTPALSQPKPRYARMWLNGGVINGVAVDPSDPRVVVEPGGPIRGWLRVTLDNVHGEGADFPVIETSTWGNPRTSYEIVTEDAPSGVIHMRVPIDRVAPTKGGAYYIIVAGAAERGSEYLASGTNYTCGRPIWGNGTSVARWSESQVAAGATAGLARPVWPASDGRRIRQEVATVAISVHAVSAS